MGGDALRCRDEVPGAGGGWGGFGAAGAAATAEPGLRGQPGTRCAALVLRGEVRGGWHTVCS